MTEPDTDALPPSRIPWDTAWELGQVDLDHQHHDLLAQCNRLADLCADAGTQIDSAGFDAAFEHLKALVRQHRQTEAAWLSDLGTAALDGHHDEFDEFEYLVEEIVTTVNFERLELQRFLSLWCLGHVAGTTPRMREWLAGSKRSG